MWFVVAVWWIRSNASNYSSVGWKAVEYLSLFVIVLMHEFGHSLACRQVGGRADRIVLWPLGGVAYVAPPHRPGATLWSIAAGPLVNVVLFPVFSLAMFLSDSMGLAETSPDLAQLFKMLWFINTGLLVFNLLPIYPLDGGQILRALFWFMIGPSKSLMVAAVVGMVGVVGLVLLAGVAVIATGGISGGTIWLIIIALFILMNCGRGLIHARNMARVEAAPRHSGYCCPSCKAVPPFGDFWHCGRCRKPFDLIQSRGICPHCDTGYSAFPCLDCGIVSSMEDWVDVGGGSSGSAPPGAVPPRL
jgi:Zn-dependent protease